MAYSKDAKETKSSSLLTNNYQYEDKVATEVSNKNKTISQKSFKIWQNNPVAFFEDCLGIGNCPCGCKIDPKQIEMALDVRDMIVAREKKHNGEKLTEREKELIKLTGITVKACKGGGKTALLAMIYLYWISLFPVTQKHMVTAPTQNHLKDNLFSEISKWISHSKKYAKVQYVSQTVELQGLKLFRKAIYDKNTGKIDKSAVGKECILVGRTASKSSDSESKKATMQGYHDTYQMIGADESFGVDDAVFEPLETTLTRAVNFAFLIGNPTRNSGYAFDTFNKHSDMWINHTISLEETTLVTQEYVDRMKKKYKDYPNLYRIFVLGEFPLDDDNALIPYNKIMDAVDRYKELEADDPRVTEFDPIFGCDIGCGADLSIVVKKQGIRRDILGRLKERDTLVTARWIAAFADIHEPKHMGVDGIAWGKGTYDKLRELGYNATFVDSRKKASVDTYKRYRNVRAECYFKLAQKFIDDDIAIPDDEELIAELSIINIKDSMDILQIQSKKEMKANGIDSPNLADSMAYCEYFSEKAMNRRNSEIRRYRRVRAGSSSGSWMGV